jgi:hypothetical protein
LLDASEDSFEEISTNLQGLYFLMQAIARDQIARRATDPAFEAAIVFIHRFRRSLVDQSRRILREQGGRVDGPGSRCGWPSTASRSTRCVRGSSPPT